MMIMIWFHTRADTQTEGQAKINRAQWFRPVADKPRPSEPVLVEEVLLTYGHTRSVAAQAGMQS